MWKVLVNYVRSVGMSYKVRFPNDWTFVDVPELKTFELHREFEDSVFGWFGHGNRLYVQIPMEDYKRWLAEKE